MLTYASDGQLKVANGYLSTLFLNAVRASIAKKKHFFETFNRN